MGRAVARSDEKTACARLHQRNKNRRFKLYPIKRCSKFGDGSVLTINEWCFLLHFKCALCLKYPPPQNRL